jgi:hypothetical protein
VTVPKLTTDEVTAFLGEPGHLPRGVFNATSWLPNRDVAVSWQPLLVTKLRDN